MKKLRTAATACVIVILALLATNLNAGVTFSDDARIVLDRNPQLRQVPDFPPIVFAEGVNQTQGNLIRLINVRDCPPNIRALEIAQGAGQKCLVVIFRGSAHSYESAYNKEKTFFAVLAMNSPRVVSAYQGNPSQLMARFDASGRITSLPEPTPGRRPGETRDECLQRLSGWVPGQSTPKPGSPVHRACLDSAASSAPNAASGSQGLSSQAPTQVQLEDCSRYHALMQKALCEAKNNNIRAASGTTPMAQPVPAAQGTAGSYECYASTKDTMMETVRVQAASVDAARLAVLQHLGARSFGPATIQCTKL